MVDPKGESFPSGRARRRGRGAHAGDGSGTPASGPTRRSRPTIFDVADLAGVSYSTVSRVVNERRHIHPETRARVQSAMTELGYVAHRPAQSLASGQSRTVGLLAIEVGTSFFQEIIAGVDDQVAESGYDFMLCTTHDQRGKENEYVARLSHGIVDGLLIILPRGLTEYVQRLRAERFPFVIIDHDAEASGCSLVNASNRTGAREAIAHLISLGHRRIGFISGTPGVGSAAERLKGYRDAMDAASVPIDEALIVEGDFLEARGREASLGLLARPEVERPTAIFASADTAALGVLRAARELGLSVPRDLSVVGFDDVPESRYVMPALTTVAQPLREMGKAAVRMLMDILREPDRPPATMVLSTSLVVRDSTGSAPRARHGAIVPQEERARS